MTAATPGGATMLSPALAIEALERRNQTIASLSRLSGHPEADLVLAVANQYWSWGEAERALPYLEHQLGRAGDATLQMAHLRCLISLADENRTAVKTAVGALQSILQRRAAGQATLAPPEVDPRSDRKLRLGFLCTYSNLKPVEFSLVPMLRAIDRSRLTYYAPHRSFRSLRASHACRADKFQNHVRKSFRRLLGDQTTAAGKANQAPTRNCVGHLIAEFWTDETVLITPNNQRRTVYLTKFHLGHVFVVDGTRQRQKMIEAVLTHVGRDVAREQAVGHVRRIGYTSLEELAEKRSHTQYPARDLKCVPRCVSLHRLDVVGRNAVKRDRIHQNEPVHAFRTVEREMPEAGARERAFALRPCERAALHSGGAFVLRRSHGSTPCRPEAAQ